MRIRPMEKVSQFLGMKIGGYDLYGKQIWEEEITSIQKCGKIYKPGYYHFWLNLSRTHVTGTVEDCERWIKAEGRKEKD